MVIFLTIRNSPQEIRVDASTFYRDIGMYIVATVTTIVFAWIGELTITTSIIFLLVIVYFQDRAEAQKKKQRKCRACFRRNIRKRSPQSNELSVLWKIDFIILFPFEVLRKLTMPPCEEDRYNKRYVIIWPFGGLLFALWSFHVEYIYWLYLGLPLMIIISLAFYFTQQKTHINQIPSYFWLITTIGTIWGLLCTYIATTILIDLLNAFIVVLKLNNTYMGLTVLGIGNALPDALTTIALAKEGISIYILIEYIQYIYINI